MLQAHVLGSVGMSLWSGLLPADEKPQCCILSGSELAIQLGDAGKVSGGSLAMEGCPRSSLVPHHVPGFVGQDLDPAQS